MRETILNIDIVILSKSASYTIPKNVVKSIRLNKKEYWDDLVLDRIGDVDFSKYYVMVIYVDTNRFNTAKEFLYNMIERITGVTKTQIKGQRGTSNIVLARRMFHYGLKSTTPLTLVEISVETNNDHSTILASLKEIGKDARYKTPIEIEYFGKVKDEISKYKAIETTLNTIPS